MVKGIKLNETMVIACAGDDAFALPMAVTIYSALCHLEPNQRVDLYLFDGGISQPNKTRIEHVVNKAHSLAEINWITPELSAFDKLSTPDSLNSTTYIRLAVSLNLPDTVKKVIFLDSDLVVKSDLSSMWALDMGENICLAVKDYGCPYVSCPIGLVHTYVKLGLPAGMPYFNAGVLVINPELWREENITPDTLAFLIENQDTVQHADQEGLNAILANRWGEIDARWNVQIGALQHFSSWPDSPHKEGMQPQLSSLLANPYILHYTGARKPWKAGLTNPMTKYFRHNVKRCNYFSLAEYRTWYMRWLKSSVQYIWNDIKPNKILNTLKASRM